MHFLVLDNIHWGGKEAKRYWSELGPDQLAFIENDLAHIDKQQLVVVMFHIPIWEVKDLSRLAALLKEFPHSLSIAAHTHTQRQHFIDDDTGWQSGKPHHHLVAGTVCGSWWSGVPDEYGVPHTLMRDGTPNGYIIMSLDGSDYSWRYQVARRRPEFQMTIFTPEVVKAADAPATDILANIFNGSERSTVRMRVRGHGDWTPMQREERNDPFFERVKEREATLDARDSEWAKRGDLGLKLPKPSASTHIWVAKLPENLPAGSHLIEVETTDMFGQQHVGRRVFRVEP